MNYCNPKFYSDNKNTFQVSYCCHTVDETNHCEEEKSSTHWKWRQCQREDWNNWKQVELFWFLLDTDQTWIDYCFPHCLQSDRNLWWPSEVIFISIVIFFGVPHFTFIIFLFIEYVKASIAYVHPVYGGIQTHNLLAVIILL